MCVCVCLQSEAVLVSHLQVLISFSSKTDGADVCGSF